MSAGEWDGCICGCTISGGGVCPVHPARQDMTRYPALWQRLTDKERAALEFWGTPDGLVVQRRLGCLCDACSAGSMCNVAEGHAATLRNMLRDTGA